MKEGGDSRIELPEENWQVVDTRSTGKEQRFFKLGCLLEKRQRAANISRSKLTRHQTFTILYVGDVPQMYSEIFDKFTSILKNILINPLQLRSQCFVDFQPFPSVIGKHSQERGGNAMGISVSDAHLILLEIQCSWSSPNDDKVFKDASKKLLASGQGP